MIKKISVGDREQSEVKSSILDRNGNHDKETMDEDMREVEEELNIRESKPLETVWDERRKRTLILKGMNTPNDTSVLAVIQQYKLATPENIEKISVRKILGRGEWVFIVFKSIQGLEDSFRNKGNLKGSRFFIQRDRSFEERKRFRESTALQGIQSTPLLPSPAHIPVIPLSGQYPSNILGAQASPFAYPNAWVPWGLRTPQIFPQWPLQQINQRHSKWAS